MHKNTPESCYPWKLQSSLPMIYRWNSDKRAMTSSCEAFSCEHFLKQKKKAKVTVAKFRRTAQKLHMYYIFICFLYAFKNIVLLNRNAIFVVSTNSMPLEQNLLKFNLLIRIWMTGQSDMPINCNWQIGCWRYPVLTINNHGLILSLHSHCVFTPIVSSLFHWLKYSYFNCVIKHLQLWS